MKTGPGSVGVQTCSGRIFGEEEKKNSIGIKSGGQQRLSRLKGVWHDGTSLPSYVTLRPSFRAAISGPMAAVPLQQENIQDQEIVT